MHMSNLLSSHESPIFKCIGTNLLLLELGSYCNLQVKSIDSDMVQHWDEQVFQISSFFFA